MNSTRPAPYQRVRRYERITDRTFPRRTANPRPTRRCTAAARFLVLTLIVVSLVALFRPVAPPARTVAAAMGDTRITDMAISNADVTTAADVTYAPAAQPSAEQACGVLDLGGCITGAVNTFLRATVADALNPMLALLSDTLLTTPKPSQLPRLVELWNGSWEILFATYALLVAAAGILLMGYQTVQSRYTVRELAPRIVLGFCAGALSLTGASAAIEFTNAVTATVLAGGVDDTAAADALARLVTSAIAPPLPQSPPSTAPPPER
jgi:hypothetical protein